MSNNGWRTGLLSRQHWMLYLVPFFVYMLAGSLEPTPESPGGSSIGLAIPYSYYPSVYAAKIALTIVAMAFVFPGYRQFPLKVGGLAIFIGIVGGPLWIGICHFDVEHLYLQPLFERVGLGDIIGAGTRAAFNPFEQMSNRPEAAWVFLAVRFLGLVAIVPVIEEFFLRGFVMRFFMDREWWKAPFGKADRLAVVLGTAVPMLMHPAELLAALVWFSMITWLMLRTKNIWDCVVAHALTNLILGVYVVTTGTWRLM